MSGYWCEYSPFNGSKLDYFLERSLHVKTQVRIFRSHIDAMESTLGFSWKTVRGVSVPLLPRSRVTRWRQGLIADSHRVSIMGGHYSALYFNHLKYLRLDGVESISYSTYKNLRVCKGVVQGLEMVYDRHLRLFSASNVPNHSDLDVTRIALSLSSEAPTILLHSSASEKGKINEKKRSKSCRISL